MADLFSDAWMKALMTEWNNEPELADALAQINFNSSIAYGIDGEDKPRGIIVIENGKAVSASAYNGETMNWDLRASADNWGKWMEKGIGMMGLGMAYTSRKLKFQVGDYMAMIKDPRMATPFVKSFTVMGRVKV
jgi:sulfur carrier protein ThiS